MARKEPAAALANAAAKEAMPQLWQAVHDLLNNEDNPLNLTRREVREKLEVLGVVVI